MWPRLHLGAAAFAFGGFKKTNPAFLLLGEKYPWRILSIYFLPINEQCGV
jgi:hypothetical protein